MLVLGRKEGDGIIVEGRGLRITVTYVERRGPWVRIGIDAPPDVKILRKELLHGNNDQRKVQEEKEAGKEEK